VQPGLAQVEVDHVLHERHLLTQQLGRLRRWFLPFTRPRRLLGGEVGGEGEGAVLVVVLTDHVAQQLRAQVGEALLEHAVDVAQPGEILCSALHNLNEPGLVRAAGAGCNDFAAVVEGHLAGEQLGLFPESEVFASPASLLAFVPAYPAGGRITRDGVHLVRLDGRFVPAHDTEYADDPVFPFDTAVLHDYVEQRSARTVVTVDLATVRAGSADLGSAVLGAADGSVLTFDAETDDDIERIATALRAARAAGRDVVIRSAATLAAELAGVRSTGLLDVPLDRDPGHTLLVCGSHTEGAARQLEPVIARFGPPIEIATEAALAAPEETGRMAEKHAAERVRSAAHNTLDHGERVMRALTSAVAVAAPDVTAVVSKGGITSAEVARVGIGARRATVRGQVVAGVSVWDLRGRDGHAITYIVVPGNVGDDQTITTALAALGLDHTSGTDTAEGRP